MADAGKPGAVDALVPDDPRVEHHDVQIGPYNYHYMLAHPPDGAAPAATALLCHGWPDLGVAWRYQIPYLTAKLRLRVIAPDMLGYGRTSAPDDAREYAFKKVAGHMRALVEHVCGGSGPARVILGGHDWGGAFAWRMALWQPETVAAVFSLNVPFTPVMAARLDLADVVARVPSFRYQQQFASGEAERILAAKPGRLRRFLDTVYGGTGPDGEVAFSTVGGGIVEDLLDRAGPARLMGPEWVDHYVREFERHDGGSLRGPFNWYRTRDVNFDDEAAELLPSPERTLVRQPSMVVMGEKDPALPPRLADGSERLFVLPLRKEVVPGVGHWAMWQDPETVNRLIGEFVEGVLGAAKGKL